MRDEPSQSVTLFSQLKGWVSGDRLAYLLILFTLAMGAITAYVLASVDFVSGDTDFLVPLLGVDVLALAVLAFSVGRQFWRLWVCLLYTSPSPRDQRGYRMPSSA